jgi:hypothetical protein
MKVFDKKQIVIFSVVIGLIFPLFALILELGRLNLSFSIESIIEVHRGNPAMILLGLIPLIFGIVGGFIYSFLAKKQQEVERINLHLSNQTQNINKVATFAEEIGNGRYDIDFVITDDSDTLGKTLQNLQG